MALARDGRLLAEALGDPSLTHGQRLPRALQDLLDVTGHDSQPSPSEAVRLLLQRARVCVNKIRHMGIARWMIASDVGLTVTRQM